MSRPRPQGRNGLMLQVGSRWLAVCDDHLLPIGTVVHIDKTLAGDGVDRWVRVTGYKANLAPYHGEEHEFAEPVGHPTFTIWMATEEEGGR